MDLVHLLSELTRLAMVLDPDPIGEALLDVLVGLLVQVVLTQHLP